EQQSTLEMIDYRGKLIMPAFIDTHCHYPQSKVIGSYGRQLLDWLNDYTFPTEASFTDPQICADTADYFIQRLLAHGTTTASVFATVHPHSVDAFMQRAEQYNLRMLCGKVLMDRNSPDNLRNSAEQSAQDSADLIERWHGRARLRYSITPRFAPTSTPTQLQLAGELFHSRSDLHVQSHLSENKHEIAWVQSLFPERLDYLDVYDHYGLTGARSIYAHGIHLSAREQQAMREDGTAVAFSPTSNLFLGSGFFDYAQMTEQGIRVGLATDVGGGTSFSLIRTLADAYKVSQVHERPTSALRGWYLATLGGARALYLDEFIGNFETGKEADFVVLDFERLPELAFRLAGVTDLTEHLFAFTILGDERCIQATYAMGQPVYVSQ
ncbi:MAG: guanine deaminase, partial [Pseudomonadota bacterium]|nr:guanine deaminase [Pseudomonadota bacterium]